MLKPIAKKDIHFFSFRAFLAVVFLGALSFSALGQIGMIKNDKKSLSNPGLAIEACSSSSIETNGNSGLSGTPGNSRTFSLNGISVKATAFSRSRTTGAWETAFLGAFSSGLGVTDQHEGAGLDDSHKVDNQGGYDNYILFEFNQTVVIDQVRLDLVANDSDMTAWIGSANNPYNNHLSLSDALLASFASEDNNASNSSDRWANINAAGRAGNVLVVAASTSDTTPDDAFKVHYLSVGCPQTPATVTIIKQVQLPGGGTASTESFPFAATNFIPSSFSLVDNNVTGPDRVSAQVYNFGSGNPITIKENQMFSWSLLAIECTGTGTYTASGNITTGIATITVQPGATVTCTYRNSRLTTTAAPVNITGRVLDANGAPIGGATLFLADPGTGVQQTARTNPFGYYKFEGIDNENFYVLRVSDRRHTFVPDTMYFSLIDNLDGADFVAMP